MSCGGGREKLYDCVDVSAVAKKARVEYSVFLAYCGVYAAFVNLPGALCVPLAWNWVGRNNLHRGCAYNIPYTIMVLGA